ncbi:MAG: putative metal-dependent hydrolase [Gemmatimonadaceae bacterium]|jgi:hypothetical protein|nr:putative metal-dependent hydrolase [Gemmatimonadaceae bacterium]
MHDDALRFPIGKFVRPTQVSRAERDDAVARIAALPRTVRAAVEGLDPAQLDTPYRPGGWTVREVVHHLGDSHLNAYARLALGLTEDAPMIRAYDENTWVRVGATTQPLAAQLDFLEVLHARLHALAATVSDETGARTLVHPVNGPLTVNVLLALYAWHGQHHVAHITTLRERNGW